MKTYLNRPTIYIIGNGYKSPEQMEFLKDKVTFGCGGCIWEWIPTYYAILENPIYEKQFLINKTLLKSLEYDEMNKFYPDWFLKHCHKPSTTFIQIIKYDQWEQHGYSNAKGIMSFGSTGANATLLAIKYLRYKNIVLIGMTGNYPNGKKELNFRTLRSWSRLKYYLYKTNKNDVFIFNASIKSKIECFPKITL